MAQIVDLKTNEKIHFESYASIGRASKSTFSLKDRKLSRLHCEIIKVEGVYLLVDLQSQNGTKVNNEDVFQTILKNGDNIQIGKSEISFYEG